KRLRKINPRIARDIETVCHKAIEKDPNKRYPTAREFADDMRRFLAGESIDARPPSPVSRVIRGVRQHRVACLLVACAGAAAAAAGGGAQQVRGRREEARLAFGQLFERPVEPQKLRSSAALVEIRNRLQQAKRLESALDESDRARIAALSERFDRDIANRRALAVAHLQRGLGKSSPPQPGLPPGTHAP